MISNFLVAIPKDNNPGAYKILLPLGLLLLLSKVFALVLGKIKVPQVIAYLLAGLVVGLIYLIPNQNILTEYTVTDGLSFFSKVAVILIMFSAGIETDIKKVKSVGLASFFIALMGVLVPMFLTFLVAFIIDKTTGGSLHLENSSVNPIYTELYYGVILTATSVSVTVATLKELGKLDSKIGSALVSAAIIDDIIGIIVLSLVISLASSSNNQAGSDFASMLFRLLPENIQTPAMNIVFILLFMIIFFALTFGAGFFIRKLFNYLGTKFPHHIRITILSLAFCFIWSYLAEFFNIADITGAYLMGLILSSTVAHGYIDHRAETTCNYLFAPVFFGNIAMGMYQSNFDFSNPKFVTFMIFGIVWIFLGLLGKVLGSGLAGLCFKFGFHGSLIVGFGMMARAEVLIVCAEKGISAGIVSDNIMPFCLLLILISSFATPIFLKLAYRSLDKAEERMKLKEESVSSEK